MAEIFRGINWTELNEYSVAMRIFLAIVIGGIIGLERGIKNQPAGFRTYMLVCLGASLVMMTNQYICNVFGNGDPSRLGAQVVSGIGFLGAGTILVTKGTRIRGLTTAAGLWTAACVGLAIGIGFYQGAVLAGITIFLVMTVFQRIDHQLHASSRLFPLYMNFISGEAINRFMDTCNDIDLKVIDMQMTKDKGNRKGTVVAVCTVKSEVRKKHVEIIEELAKIEGVRSVEEV